MLERWFPLVFGVAIMALSYVLFTRTDIYCKLPPDKRPWIRRHFLIAIAVAAGVGLYHALE